MKQKLKKMCFQKTQILMFKYEVLYDTFNFKTPYKLYRAVSFYLKDKDYQLGTNEIYVGDITLQLSVVEYSTSL